MGNFELLEQEIYDMGIEIDYVDFKSNRIKGLCCNGSIALSKSLYTSAEKSCVAAEELAHHQLTIGNIIDLKDDKNRKQEYTARLWAYNKQIGLYGIIRAFERGCRERCDVADFLNVTEEFLLEAIDCYRGKYGVCEEVDNYVIFFEPCLAVMEQIK